MTRTLTTYAQLEHEGDTRRYREAAARGNEASRQLHAQAEALADEVAFEAQITALCATRPYM